MTIILSLFMVFFLELHLQVNNSIQVIGQLLMALTKLSKNNLMFLDSTLRLGTKICCELVNLDSNLLLCVLWDVFMASILAILSL